MSALELIIPGDFWDSWLYAGRMYLFHRDSSISVLDWDGFIGELRHKSGLNQVMRYLFRQSDYLYATFLTTATTEGDRRRLSAAMAALDGDVLEMSLTQLEKWRLLRIANPLPFPHADSVIYGGFIFAGNRHGLARTTDLTSLEARVSPVRMWDGPVVSLAAGYGSLALAAGSDGLFEVPVWHLREDDVYANGSSPVRRQTGLRTAASWVYLGLYGASNTSGRYMRYVPKGKEPYRRVDDRELAFEADESAIFGRQGFSWGGGDRFGLYRGGEVSMVRFVPQARREGARFRRMAPRKLKLRSRLVAASNAHFGAVLEDEAGLNVVLSNEQAIRLPGEPVNWRVFPRSRHYLNQLHIAGEHQLRVIAFTHDFALDQSIKSCGIRYALHRNIQVEMRYLLPHSLHI